MTTADAIRRIRTTRNRDDLVPVYRALLLQGRVVDWDQINRATAAKFGIDGAIAIYEQANPGGPRV